MVTPLPSSSSGFLSSSSSSGGSSSSSSSGGSPSSSSSSGGSSSSSSSSGGPSSSSSSHPGTYQFSGSNPHGAALSTSAQPIDILLTDGKIVRVPAGFDPTALETVLGILQRQRQRNGGL